MARNFINHGETFISEETRDLLNHLDVGIIIFRGSTLDELIPIFYNDGSLKISEMDEQTYFACVNKDTNYGTHPDEIMRVRDKFRSLFFGAEQIHLTTRVMKKNKQYDWISLNARISYNDDGSFFIYMVFANADDAKQLHRLQDSNRLHQKRKLTKAVGSGVARALLNLSQNLCVERFYTHTPRNKNDIVTAKELLDEVAVDIAYDEYKKEFLEQFCVEQLFRDEAEGIMEKEMRVPFLREGRSAMWYQIRSELFHNPDSEDLELFLTFTDVDKEMRFGSIIDRLLDSEYEVLGQIDVKSGCFTTLGRGKDGSFGERSDEDGDYQNTIKTHVERMLPQEYWEEGYDAFSLDRVIYELSKKESYSFTFPMVADWTRDERICRWRYEYVDDVCSTILLIRTNVSEILNYGYDSVTGMFDRKGFCQRAREILNANPQMDFCLMEVDFDNFKLVNQTLGYSAGSRLIRQFGADLRQKAALFGNDCVIGHVEGDHFLILLPTDREKTPEEVYEELHLLTRVYKDAGNLRLRMGVYEINDKSLDVSVMCDSVLLALRACKGRFDKRINYYSEGIRDRILDSQLLSSEMQAALDAKQFDIWFQPQVNHAKGGSLVGAEALVRWMHPTRGMISPNVFIPMFEQNGFIYELDKYVWRRTCQYIRTWLDEGKEPLPISVNVSRMDIIQNDFLETICSIVEEERVPRDLFHIEITETAFTENAARVVKTVNELIDRGFMVAIDDFGSGYSSLSMLKSVQAQILKLDMSFFADQEDQSRNECIIESIVRMAKMLGMAVLAEGVEYVEQANLLQTMGCDYVQGYLYSKPLPHNDYTEYKEQTENGSETISAVPREYSQKEQLESQELFRKIVSGTNDIIVVADIHTKHLLYANREAERYFEKTFDILKPTTCCEFCNNSKACFDCPANALKRGERIEKVSIENEKHFKILYSRMDWNGHEAFVFYQTDITAEMHELEFADSLIKNIPAAMVIMEQDEAKEVTLTYVSDRVHEIFANTAIKSVLPTLQECFDILHPDDKKRIFETVTMALREKKRFQEEFRIMLEDGSFRWVDYAINPVMDQNGKCLFYGIFTDISERRDLE